MNIAVELGIRIRHYRKEKHITQEQLAEICSMHPTYIGQLERGEKNATLESVYRIAKGLDISISKLLENMEDIENAAHDIPNSIYQQLLMLPRDKQQDIQDILQKIINLI